jgi:hypothetical protein
MTSRIAPPWIQVGSEGKRVDLPKGVNAPLSLSHIELDDLIPALSRQCRFNGHCKVFYSVLEHQCLVSALAPPGFKREALMHDLAEAITGDMITPLKRAGAKPALYDRIEVEVAKRFAFQWPSSTAVHAADQHAMRVEYQHLIPHTDPWPGMALMQTAFIPGVLGYLGRTPAQAETLWWDMWADALVDG